MVLDKQKELSRETVASAAIFNRGYIKGIFKEAVKNYQKAYNENKGAFGNIKKSLGIYKLSEEDKAFLDSVVGVNEWIETGNGNVLGYLQNIHPYLPKETVSDSLHIKSFGLEDILKQRINEIGKTSSEIYKKGSFSRSEYFNQISMARMFSNNPPVNLEELKKELGESEEYIKYTYNDFVSAHYKAEAIFDAYIDLGLKILEVDAKKEFSNLSAVYHGAKENRGIDSSLQEEMDKSFLNFNEKVKKSLEMTK